MNIIYSIFKRSFFIVFITAAYVIFDPSPSYPYYCLGGYFTTQYGANNWNIGNSSSYLFTAQNPPTLTRPVMPGGGLVWTGDFFEDQFMFRQNLGLEAQISKQFKMTRLSFNNTYAYVPVRTDTYSVWFGLQLNLFYMWGKDAKNSFLLYSDASLSNIPIYTKRRYQFLTIGTGLAVGLDYNVNEYIRLSFEAGFHISPSVYGQSHEIGNAEASVLSYEGYAAVAVMYRFQKRVKWRQFE